MSDAQLTSSTTAETLPARAVPTLTPEQMARIAARGRRRATAAGDVLFEPGDKAAPTFVVVSGELQVLLPTATSETLIVTYGPGQFSGEVNAINGRPAIARLRVTKAGEVIELDREQLLNLIQRDAELSEIVMRALILRRVALIAGQLGDVVVAGSLHSAGTLRVKEFLARNGHPFHYLDLDHDPGAQELLDRFAVAPSDVPVVVCRGHHVLRNPTNAQVAECLGFNDAIDESHVSDLVIVGAGP